MDTELQTLQDSKYTLLICLYTGQSEDLNIYLKFQSSIGRCPQHMLWMELKTFTEEWSPLEPEVRLSSSL